MATSFEIISNKAEDINDAYIEAVQVYDELKVKLKERETEAYKIELCKKYTEKLMGVFNRIAGDKEIIKNSAQAGIEEEKKFDEKATKFIEVLDYKIEQINGDIERLNTRLVIIKDSAVTLQQLKQKEGGDA